MKGGGMMSKYEESKSESQYQQNYAKKIRQGQLAYCTKKHYDPLYPESDGIKGDANDEGVICNSVRKQSERKGQNS
jgi:hypothetical protein